MRAWLISLQATLLLLVAQAALAAKEEEETTEDSCPPLCVSVRSTHPRWSIDSCVCDQSGYVSTSIPIIALFRTDTLRSLLNNIHLNQNRVNEGSNHTLIHWDRSKCSLDPTHHPQPSPRLRGRNPISHESTHLWIQCKLLSDQHHPIQSDRPPLISEDPIESLDPIRSVRRLTDDNGSDDAEEETPCFMDNRKFDSQSMLNVTECMHCLCFDGQLICFDLKCNPKYCEELTLNGNFTLKNNTEKDYSAKNQSDQLTEEMINDFAVRFQSNSNQQSGSMIREHLTEEQSVLNSSLKEFALYMGWDPEDDYLRYQCCFNSSGNLCPYSLAYDDVIEQQKQIDQGSGEDSDDSGHSSDDGDPSDEDEDGSGEENREESDTDDSDSGNDRDSSENSEEPSTNRWLTEDVEWCSRQDTCAECLSLWYCVWEGNFCSNECVLQSQSQCWISKDAYQVWKQREHEYKEEHKQDENEEKDSEEIMVRRNHTTLEPISDSDDKDENEPGFIYPDYTVNNEQGCPNQVIVYLQISSELSQIDTQRATERHTNLLSASLIKTMDNLLVLNQTTLTNVYDGADIISGDVLSTNLITISIVEAVAKDKVECRLAIVLTQDKGEDLIPSLLSNSTSFIRELNSVLHLYFKYYFTGVSSMKSLSLQCSDYDCYAFEDREYRSKDEWYEHLFKLTYNLAAFSSSLLILLVTVAVLFHHYPPCAYCCCCQYSMRIRFQFRECFPCLCRSRRKLVYDLDDCHVKFERMKRRKKLLEQMRHEEIQLGPEMDDGKSEEEGSMDQS